MYRHGPPAFGMYRQYLEEKGIHDPSNASVDKLVKRERRILWVFLPIGLILLLYGIYEIWNGFLR
jgi:hypothetical protein